MQGSLPDFQKYMYVCIVGSRKYSSYGKNVCEYIVQSLKGYPVVIVSGLALGIDGIAHHAALNAMLPTIAILGSGLDTTVLYPAQHRYLSQQILTSGGALLTELDPKIGGAHWTFPRRNRLMAAISDVIIVIEAEQKSGTKITATYGAEYGREVFAVPGSIFSKNSVGIHELIADGAQPFISIEHFLDTLGFTTRPESAEATASCTIEEQEILGLLTRPCSRSELVQQTDFSIARINTLIMQLEMRDFVKESNGVLHRIR
jgi:DNA processing protein